MKYRTICENHLFKKVYAAGRRSSRGSLTVYLLNDKKAALLKKQNPLKQKYNRIGITVTKKIGNAVERSRARRVIREALRLLEKEKGETMAKGKLLVFVARSGILRKKTGAVKEEMDVCFRDLGLYRPGVPVKNEDP